MCMHRTLWTTFIQPPIDSEKMYKLVSCVAETERLVCVLTVLTVFFCFENSLVVRYTISMYN